MFAAESQVEPEVKDEQSIDITCSEPLRSESPASCLQLVKQEGEPLAGSEHGGLSLTILMS